MGRSSRKSASTAEPREHWTDTHPDRNMWSPGRLAIARTQTQEEYEALYGRSQEPVKPKPEIDTPKTVMADHEMLDQLALDPMGSCDLHVGTTLVNPLANSREYRGLIRVRRDPREGMVYEGVTQYGRSGNVGSHEKVVFSGSSIELAADAVNSMIEKKLAADYEVPPGESGRVDSSLARNEAHNICINADARSAYQHNAI